MSSQPFNFDDLLRRRKRFSLEDPSEIPAPSIEDTYDLSALTNDEPPMPDFQSVGPERPNRVKELEERYDEKPSWKRSLLEALIPAAGIAVGGIFGGQAGATGAAQGATEGMRYNQAQKEIEKGRLFKEMEAARAQQAHTEDIEASLKAKSLEANLNRQMEMSKLQQAAKEGQLNRTNAQMLQTMKNEAPANLPEGAIRVNENGQITASNPKVPKPGVDVPLSDVVANQKRELGAPYPVAGRDKPYITPVFDQLKDLKELGVPPQGQLTPGGVDLMSDLLLKGAPLPSMGYRGGQKIADIINKTAAKNPGADLASNKAAYSADKTSLTNLQKSYDAIVSFERTAQKNMDILLDTSKNITDTGSPLFNTPIRLLQEKVFGDKDLPAFRAARRIDVNEIAKIVSNPNMTGVLTDEARNEINSLIPDNVTLNQLFSVAKLLRRDMNNRKTSMEEQISTIKQRISGVQTGQNAAGGNQAPVEEWERVNGKLQKKVKR
jgi:hypothetical protein